MRAVVDNGFIPVIGSAIAQRCAIEGSAPDQHDPVALQAVCRELHAQALEAMDGYWQWPDHIELLLTRWAPPDQSDCIVQKRLNLLMLALVESLPDRLQQSGLPAEFAAEYQLSARRITERIATGRRWEHGLEDDIFRKDLALLCLRMVPCVSHLVCRYSGVPRRNLLLPSNLLSGASARVVFALSGRLRPLMANHVHPEMVDRFDPAGRNACYRLVGALLGHWPDSAGLVGASWYYDRAVAGISPHLAYLRDVPAQHGALFLDAGAAAEAKANALFGSQRRRARIEDGSYKPRTVMMVWPRQALLAHVAQAAVSRTIA